LSYQALYRVWRPQQFSDVVGQEHITKTLQNALLQQKTSHAYLFTGPRGTGKTSAAKIFAKAVNCERAPVKEPCNECPSCRGITDGTISDVIEIDAASNNGVDEIRDIRDKVKYAPSVAKYKVYIIDEVHMLSIGAFNALLKTLEEPPKHVIFILATTEPHKIPLTIISRCQRFDFKRISAASMVERMKLIVGETGIQCDEKALQVIARAAEGGMRDALSLLDQAISFSEDEVTVEDALTVTGSVSQNYMNQLAAAVKEKNVTRGLKLLEDLLFQGKDPTRFIEDFILFYRDLLLYKAAPNLEESLERVMLDEAFLNLSHSIKHEEIYEIIDILNKVQQEIRWTNHPRIFLEVAIVKLCQLKDSVSESSTGEIEKLLNKVSSLEDQIRELKKHGVKVSDEVQTPSRKQAPRSSRRSYQAPVGRINEILNEATKSDLGTIKSRWGEMMAKLIPSHAALLKEAEPVAASPSAFIIKFKHEIHCQMAMERTDFLSTLTDLFSGMLGKNLQIVNVPEEQWLDIRKDFIKGHHEHDSKQNGFEQKEEDDPIVSEAQKLFGDLIEIRD
jgi:DNA polymerase-3 subunit gamma/tau